MHRCLKTELPTSQSKGTAAHGVPSRGNWLTWSEMYCCMSMSNALVVTCGLPILVHSLFQESESARMSVMSVMSIKITIQRGLQWTWGKLRHPHSTRFGVMWISPCGHLSWSDLSFPNFGVPQSKSGLPYVIYYNIQANLILVNINDQYIKKLPCQRDTLLQISGGLLQLHLSRADFQPNYTIVNKNSLVISRKHKDHSRLKPSKAWFLYLRWISSSKANHIFTNHSSITHFLPSSLLYFRLVPRLNHPSAPQIGTA